MGSPGGTTARVTQTTTNSGFTLYSYKLSPEIKPFLQPRLKTEETMASGGRRKSSILVNRKLSTDFSRKLSAISVASDISLISDRFGLDQGELKNIVYDILEMNLSDDFDLGSEDGMSEYGESEEPGVSIWQELQDETVRLDSRKSSSSSQASTDSLDSAEDFKPVEINLGEIRDMLSMYINKRKVSNTLLTGTKQ